MDSSSPPPPTPPARAAVLLAPAGAGTPEPQPRPTTWFGGCTNCVYSEPGPLEHLSRPLTCHLPRGGGISLRDRRRNSVCSGQGAHPPGRVWPLGWGGGPGEPDGPPAATSAPQRPREEGTEGANRAGGRRGLCAPPPDLPGAKAQGGLSLPRAPALPAPQVASLTLPPCFQRDLLCPLYFSTSNIRSIKKLK